MQGCLHACKNERPQVHILICGSCFIFAQMANFFRCRSMFTCLLVLVITGCRSRGFSPGGFLNSLGDSSVTTGNPRVLFSPRPYDVAFDEAIAAGDWNKAFYIVDTAYKTSPEIYSPFSFYSRHLYLGRIYKAKGDYREAIANFDRCLFWDRRNVLATGLRAQTYEQLGHDEKALGDYQSITTCNWENFRHIARVFAKLNKRDSAIKYYRTFLQHYPGNITIEREITRLDND